jgi:hypothetical protein
VGTGLSIIPTFRWVALKDATVYAAWLRARLAVDRPTRLVGCHGRIRSGPGLADEPLELVDRTFPA